MKPAETSNQVKKLIDCLKKGVTEVLADGKYAEYLKTVAKFHQYSFRNCLLIAMQCPTASKVASYRRWQELGRQVRKGEKGIQILVPLFRKATTVAKVVNTDEPEKLFYACKSGTVFDISQTDGEDLPELTQNLDVEVDDFAEIVAKLEKISPVPVTYQTIVNNDYAARGCVIYGDCIVVKSEMSEADKVKTLIHELAHALIHDVDNTKDRSTKEIEAESIAYIVSAALGIDSSDYSFGYVADWGAQQAPEMIVASFETIKNTADKIIQQYETIS